MRRTCKRDCRLHVHVTQGQVLEQTLTWGVDSLIKVPPRFRTTAELVVSEDSFQGNFSVRSDVSGKVSWRLGAPCRWKWSIVICYRYLFSV